jgi:hypothetical protein
VTDTSIADQQPLQCRDNDGDVWTRNENGRYTLNGASAGRRGGCRLDVIERQFGPLTVVAIQVPESQR